MSKIKVEIQLSSDELLNAIKQLNKTELEQLLSQILALIAQNKAFGLPQNEAELLLKINQSIPSDIQNFYDELIIKRDAENLTNDEHTELLKLTEQIEKLQAQRIESLADLARVRGITLTTLMENLGIQTQIYV